MSYPLVRDLAAAGIPVRLTCGVLGFSAQAFYKWRANPVSDRDWADAHVTNAILEIHADDPEFGYRFIADELEHAGHVDRANRVQTDVATRGRTRRDQRPGRGPQAPVNRTLGHEPGRGDITPKGLLFRWSGPRRARTQFGHRVVTDCRGRGRIRQHDARESYSRIGRDLPKRTGADGPT